MNISEILKANGVEVDKIETITESINKEVGEGFVSKKQYSKRMNENQELRDKLNDIEALQSNNNKDEYKSKYEAIEAEYNKYKENVQNEKITSDKLSKIKTNLKEDGVNDKLINLLIKEIDIEALEIEGESLKGWEDVSAKLKENYSDFYGKVETNGHKPNTPPSNKDIAYTKQDIDNMSIEQINENWEAIQASMKNI